MDAEELGKKLKSFFNKGAEASKNAFEKAGDKVQEFSDKSVVRLEKKQLETKLEQKYAEIGKLIEESASEINLSSEENDGKLKAFLEEVKTLKADITEKEEALK